MFPSSDNGPPPSFPPPLARFGDTSENVSPPTSSFLAAHVHHQSHWPAGADAAFRGYGLSMKPPLNVSSFILYFIIDQQRPGSNDTSS